MLSSPNSVCVSHMHSIHRNACRLFVATLFAELPPRSFSSVSVLLSIQIESTYNYSFRGICVHAQHTQQKNNNNITKAAVFGRNRCSEKCEDLRPKKRVLCHVCLVSNHHCLFIRLYTIVPTLLWVLFLLQYKVQCILCQEQPLTHTVRRLKFTRAHFLNAISWWTSFLATRTQ